LPSLSRPPRLSPRTQQSRPYPTLQLEEDRERALAWFADLAAAGSNTIASADGAKSWTITKEMAKVAVEKRRVGERKFVPNVIEPSFGIGRIITGVLEHNFSVRSGDEQRAVLSFRPVIAPYKAVVLPQDPRIPKETVRALAAALTAAGLSNSVDDSGASLGKRYARSDEVGIPFALTVDFDTAKDGCVTIRERDSCAQVRVPLAEVPGALRGMTEGAAEWAGMLARYPVVTTGEDKASAAVAGAGASGSATGGAAAAPATLAGAIASAVGAGAAASVPAHGGAGAAPAAPAAAAAAAPSSGVNPTTSGKGSVGLTMEGGARGYGKFFRPSDL
jgi:hypothetical protein